MLLNVKKLPNTFFKEHRLFHICHLDLCEKFKNFFKKGYKYQIIEDETVPVLIFKRVPEKSVLLDEINTLSPFWRNNNAYGNFLEIRSLSDHDIKPGNYDINEKTGELDEKNEQLFFYYNKKAI